MLQAAWIRHKLKIGVQSCDSEEMREEKTTTHTLRVEPSDSNRESLSHLKWAVVLVARGDSL